MNPDWRSRYEEGVAAAQAAGKVALGYFDTGVSVETKADQSPVTIADRRVEEALQNHLLNSFPMMVSWARNSGTRRANRDTAGSLTRSTAREVSFAIPDLGDTCRLGISRRHDRRDRLHPYLEPDVSGPRATEPFATIDAFECRMSSNSTGR